VTYSNAGMVRISLTTHRPEMRSCYFPVAGPGTHGSQREDRGALRLGIGDREANPVRAGPDGKQQRHKVAI